MNIKKILKLVVISAVAFFALLIIVAKNSSTKSENAKIDEPAKTEPAKVNIVETDPNPEYGEHMFALDPQRQPVRIHGNDRYWKCEGLVEPGIREIAYAEISKLREIHRLPVADANICEYSIIYFNGIKQYTLRYFSNLDEKNLCNSGGACKNMSTLNFRPFKKQNGEKGALRSYYVLGPNATTDESFSACINWSGEVISANTVCAGLSDEELNKY